MKHHTDLRSYLGFIHGTPRVPFAALIEHPPFP